MTLTKDTNKKIILIVDDDDSVLSFLSFSLQSEGFEIMAAPSAEEAFKLLKNKIPHLILLDIMLPKMDGFAFCKSAKTTPAYKDIPIIFITAYADPTTLEKTKKVAAQGLIEKPIMFDELLMQVMDGLNGHFSLPTRLKFGT